METSSLLATLSLASKAWSLRVSVVVLVTAVLKKSHGGLGIINATKRDGGEVELGSIVLEFVGLGHLGGTSLMLAVFDLGL